MKMMRSERIHPVIVLVVVGALAGSAGSAAWADIAGSSHDFSSQAWSKGERCLPCHTPHNASGPTDAPLWNHQLTAATFVPYSSETIDSTALVGQPGMTSKLCLSCHDGTVAVDSFGGAPGSTYIAPEKSVGTDLSDDHPIGMFWRHQTDTPTCSNCHDLRNGGTPRLLPFFGVGNDKRVECATCHDPHDKASQPSMLRMSNTGSALCLHCHGK